MPLANLLTEMENRHALLEVELRGLDVPVCSVFGQEKGACGFKEDGHFVKEDMLRQFPALAQTSTQRLQAVPFNGASMSGTPRVAVLFSGGPAAGGHNVIAGIRKALGSPAVLFGVKAGPKGLMAGDLFELTDADIQHVFNLGGFDLLGSDRTKIKTPEQFEKVRQTVKKFGLTGIVVIGGDDSNTNAAFLAEFLSPDHCAVVGVPKTIDGDLQVGNLLPISFGFDTATKIYAEMVGNILQDTPSSRKYWHFVKLMGRSASHVALEVALQTRPTVALISEEIAEKKMSLAQVTDMVAGAIALRASQGMSYGVVLVPEGLIEFIPELNQLVSALNEVMGHELESFSHWDTDQRLAFVRSHLSGSLTSLFDQLPALVQTQLVMDRDSHGNVQVSQIATEVLIIGMVEKRLKEIQKTGQYRFAIQDAQFEGESLDTLRAFKFATLTHFFGYEGRCGAPSRFDAAYTYNLGLVTGSLLLAGKTGYMAALTDLDKGGRALALPLSELTSVERRSGKESVVIAKALVKTSDPAFKYLESRRMGWVLEDRFSSPGPRQFWGPLADQLPMTVALNQGYSSLKYVIA